MLMISLQNAINTTRKIAEFATARNLSDIIRRVTIFYISLWLRSIFQSSCLEPSQVDVLDAETLNHLKSLT